MSGWVAPGSGVSAVSIELCEQNLTVSRLALQALSLLLLLPQVGAGQGAVVVEGPYALTPRRLALLNTIRFAEGTWRGGSVEGYRLLYGGAQFADLSRHPEITIRRRYTSAAAGAYQFLPTTWREVAAELQLKDFGPSSQDQAALFLVERRGALDDIDARGLDRAVLAKLAPEWASLPTAHGGSHYGQPVKGDEALLRFYRAQLASLSV